MKLVVQFSLVITFLFSASSYAQKFEGIATYKTQRKMNIQLDSSQVDNGMKDQIIAMMKKQFEKEYTLDFTQDESVYKEVEKLDSPSGMGNGMGFQVQIVGDGAGDVLYKNIRENRFVNQNESFSKQFLIKDKIVAREWKMEKETKNIGNYACFKASYTYERPAAVARVMTFSSNDDEKKKKKSP
ncbi:MAG: GLPGLI family protein [Flavobacteriaceae bacterium]|nr:GLPGLI family protein [Flavobacteriaceae bacterium]